MDANSHHSPTYEQVIDDTKNNYFRKIENNYITKWNKDITKVIVEEKFEDWEYYEEWYNNCLLETINDLNILDLNNNIKISYTGWIMIITDVINTLENRTIEFINNKYDKLSNNLNFSNKIKKLKLFTNCMS
jgi:hypothetical protein